MIKSKKFRVESSFFGSNVSLYYGDRCLVSLVFLCGDRTSYTTQRRKLYRLRDRILLDIGNLEHFGFTVSE